VGNASEKARKGMALTKNTRSVHAPASTKNRTARRSKHHTYMKTISEDHTVQRMREKAMLDFIEKMMCMRSKI